MRRPRGGKNSNKTTLFFNRNVSVGERFNKTFAGGSGNKRV